MSTKTELCFLLFHGQKLLGVSQAEIKQKCQQRTKELEELKTAVDSLKVCFRLTCNSFVVTAHIEVTP